MASTPTKWQVIPWADPFGYDGIVVKCPDCGKELDESKTNATEYRFCPMCGVPHKGIERMPREVK